MNWVITKFQKSKKSSRVTKVNVFKITTQLKQECIPVGCVPAARWPYAAVCFPGGIFSGGGLALGGSARGGVSQHALRQTPLPPVDRILDTLLWKYYLGPTSLRPVKTCVISCLYQENTMPVNCKSVYIYAIGSKTILHTVFTMFVDYLKMDKWSVSHRKQTIMDIVWCNIINKFSL